MIAVPLIGNKKEIWERNYELAKKLADAIEFRLDYFSDFKFTRMKVAGKITIATCRSKKDLGRFEGREIERIALLKKASEFADYVDLEMEAARSCTIKGRKGMIVSEHSKKPMGKGKLESILKEQLDLGADICKIVSTAESFSNNIEVLKFIQRNKEKNLVCFCMGEKGALSRVLSPLMGACFTFASMGKNSTASGQIDVMEMRKFYGGKMKKPTENTKIFAIIGDPISHSLSPVLYNHAFLGTKYDGRYAALRIQKEELAEWMKAMKALEISGMNVTIPHKVEVLQYLDEISEEAKKINACNTIIREKRKLKGYNTDVYGFMQAVGEERIKGKKVLLLGAGGAARAIMYALISSGAAEIAVANRNLERLAEFLKLWEKECNEKNIILKGVGFEKLEEELSKSPDLIINSTSIGMDEAKSPIEANLIDKYVNEKACVFDVVYSPLKTKLLEECEKKNAKIITGEGMLLHQAAKAFELFTGMPAPLAIMENVLKRNLI